MAQAARAAVLKEARRLHVEQRRSLEPCARERTRERDASVTTGIDLDHVALAAAQHCGVDGEHERLVASGGRALDHLLEQHAEIDASR